jgi:hypothetical protein
MMRAESRAREGVRVERTALRLASVFRRDAWEASAASVPTDDEAATMLLRLSLPQGETIEYRQESGTIVRTRSRGEQTIGREYFAFPAATRIEVAQESPRLLRLSVVSMPPAITGEIQEPQDPFTPPVAAEICARVGRASSAATGEEGRP